LVGKVSSEVKLDSSFLLERNKGEEKEGRKGMIREFMNLINSALFFLSSVSCLI